LRRRALCMPSVCGAWRVRYFESAGFRSGWTRWRVPPPRRRRRVRGRGVRRRRRRCGIAFGGPAGAVDAAISPLDRRRRPLREHVVFVRAPGIGGARQAGATAATPSRDIALESERRPREVWGCWERLRCRPGSDGQAPSHLAGRQDRRRGRPRGPRGLGADCRRESLRPSRARAARSAQQALHLQGVRCLRSRIPRIRHKARPRRLLQAKRQGRKRGPKRA
jgi:hypothetical protein